MTVIIGLHLPIAHTRMIAIVNTMVQFRRIPDVTVAIVIASVIVIATGIVIGILGGQCLINNLSCLYEYIIFAICFEVLTDFFMDFNTTVRICVILGMMTIVHPVMAEPMATETANIAIGIVTGIEVVIMIVGVIKLQDDMSKILLFFVI